MTIKKGFIGTLLSTILLLGLALPVYAEEVKRGSCEMTINSSKHNMDNPANATGDCNGLVFGYYVGGQDAFRTFGMITYDVEYSGQQFTVGTPSGQYPQAILTVYTVKEASKPTQPKEEPKEESKPTQPVEQPKEEPKEDPKKEKPKQESKPSSEKPKEEPKEVSKPSQPVEQPKEEAKEQPKETETVADKKESTNQEDGDNNDSDSESESVEKESSDKPKLAELGENQKIHSTLEKDGSEITRGQIENPHTELASSEVVNDTNESNNSFIIYVATGIGIILLSGLGWWLYKRKVS